MRTFVTGQIDRLTDWLTDGEYFKGPNGVGPKNVGVPNAGGGWIYYVGVLTPLHTMGFDVRITL